MKTLVALISGFGILVGVMVFMMLSVPEAGNYPATVTRDSAITYQIGEEIKVKPYGNDWYDGKVVGVTSEDDYIVDFCGDIGWFDSYGCAREEVKRSEMAKI